MAQAKAVKAIWKSWHFYLFFLLMSFILYGASIKNKYSMDDDLVTSTYHYPEEGSREKKQLVSRHKNVEKGIAGIPAIFRSHYAVNGKQSYSYRPVVTSSFAIEYQFFGSNPSVSHFFNVVFYAICTILLFRFIRIAAPRAGIWLPFVICLIFLIHPIHTEVVNNIKCRDELLCLAFGLLALIWMIKFYDTKKWWRLVGFVCFLLLAYLSKKTGLVFVPIALLSIHFFRELKLRYILMFGAGSLLAIFIGRLFKRALEEAVVREKMFFENPLYMADSFMERIPMFFYSLGYYIKLLVFPYPLRYYYGYNQVELKTWSDPIVWVAAVVLVGLVIWLFTRIKRKELWVFGALFFFFAIGGACNLLFPAVGIIAERFAFVASIGFSITLGYFIYKFIVSKKKVLVRGAVVVLGVIVLLCSGVIWGRNGDWYNSFTIYTADMPHLKQSAKAHSLLAQHYASTLRALQAEIRSKPNIPGNSPLITSYRQQLDSAIHHFERAIEIYPQYAVSHNNLGAMYFLFKGYNDSARINFRNAVELDTAYVEAHFNLANTYVNDYTQARNMLELLNYYDDSVANVGAGTVEFEKQRDGFVQMYSQFRAALSGMIKNVVMKSQNTERYFLNLKDALRINLDKFGMQPIFLEPEFDSRLLSEADTIRVLAANGQLDAYTKNRILGNLAQGFYNNVVKGKYRYQLLHGDYEDRMNVADSVIIYHMEKAVELNPAYAPVYSRLSQHYENTGRYDKSIKLNQQAVTIDKFSYYQMFYTNIGNAYLKKGEPAPALVAFENGVLELQRNIKDVRNDDQLAVPMRMAQAQKLVQELRQLLGNLVGLCNMLGETDKATKYTQLGQSL